MSTLIQKLHPALYPGRLQTLAGGRRLLFSRQGMWDSGSALHCAAMALAMLGRLSDPVDVRDYTSGPVAYFWDRAWPHYLHGLTPSELASFVWELNAGVQPVQAESYADEILLFCARELSAGWPVIVWIANRRTGERHAALAVGLVERDTIPNALLLLDPAGAMPVLAACNARLESGITYLVHHGRSECAGRRGRRSVDPPTGRRTTEAYCA
ncbi:hypothetical protein ACAX43_29160 [Paraburkholderia sp. IW21]|uniref:hypothetical protein n=1 Tax=Paraburkholderia sp. IW21 TaxID=3242488 RepID=UPI003520AEF9